MKPYYQDDAVTIYHGDCREIVPTLGNASFQMIFTDPPYGHNNNNGDLISRREEALGQGKGASPKDAWRPIANDGAEANDLARWVFAEGHRVLENRCCCCCCCCGGGPDPQFARWSLWLDEAFHGGFKQMVVWDKGPMGMGWHYRRSYETVLVAEKGGGCKWRGGRKVENIIRPGQYGIRKIIPSKAQHPTPKPVELPAAFISWHTDPGDTVLDPFAGGGPVGQAAKMLGRKAVLIELEERYCEIAARRMGQEVLPMDHTQRGPAQDGLFDTGPVAVEVER